MSWGRNWVPSSSAQSFTEYLWLCFLPKPPPNFAMLWARLSQTHAEAQCISCGSFLPLHSVSPSVSHHSLGMGPRSISCDLSCCCQSSAELNQLALNTHSIKQQRRHCVTAPAEQGENMPSYTCFAKLFLHGIWDVCPVEGLERG